MGSELNFYRLVDIQKSWQAIARPVEGQKSDVKQEKGQILS